jgi:site-specific DNA recombinase
MKAGKRYRYYVMHSAELRTGEPPAWRVPATDVEAAVNARLVRYLCDYREVATLAPAGAPAAAIKALVGNAARVTEQLATPQGQRSVLFRLLLGVTITSHEVSLKVDTAGLARALNLPPLTDDAPLELVTAAAKVREGKATKLVLGDPNAAVPTRDTRLVALLTEARATRDVVLASPHLSLRELGNEQQRCRPRIAKLIRLSWLSPEIATAIVEGRQPRELTARRLLEDELPLQWQAQEASVGVA